MGFSSRPMALPSLAGARSQCDNGPRGTLSHIGCEHHKKAEAIGAATKPLPNLEVRSAKFYYFCDSTKRKDRAAEMKKVSAGYVEVGPKGFILYCRATTPNYWREMGSHPHKARAQRSRTLFSMKTITGKTCQIS